MSISTKEIVLNEALIKQQGLSKADVKKVKGWHLSRLRVFEMMDKTDDPEFLHSLGNVVEHIEYALQDAWKFPRNRDLHTWWNRVPKCQCPQVDNDERLGTPWRIVSQGCPVHSIIISVQGHGLESVSHGNV